MGRVIIKWPLVSVVKGECGDESCREAICYQLWGIFSEGIILNKYTEGKEIPINYRV